MTGDQDSLPYEDTEGESTAGWSGSETSHERAQHEAASGAAGARQRRYLNLIGHTKAAGMTWREISTITGEHHGQVSGALSVLHKTHRIARLRARRNKCQIYVLTEYVNDRLTSPYSPNSKKIVYAEATAEENAAFERLRRKAMEGYAIVCLERDQALAVLNFFNRAKGP